MLPSACAGPTDQSHYVDGREARLICGACPSSETSEAERFKIAEALVVGCGVRVFYNLMNDAERKAIGCVDYTQDMNFTLQAHLEAHDNVRSPSLSDQIVYRHFPVADHCAFPSDAVLLRALDQLDADYKAGHTIYVHCLGGHGRSGILTTCWLGRRFGLPFSKAFDLNNELHAARRDTRKKHACPRKQVQQPQIERVLLGALFFKSGFLSQWHPSEFAAPLARIVQVLAATEQQERKSASAGAGAASGGGGSSAMESKATADTWLPDQYRRKVCPFAHAEMWMMASKAVLFQDWATLGKILAAKTPKACKELGRQVHPFDNATWDKHAMALVCEGTRLKFSAPGNRKLRASLIETHPTPLFEASRQDGIWGIKADQQTATKLWRAAAASATKDVFQGRNLLGKALELVRAELVAAASGGV